MTKKVGKYVSYKLSQNQYNLHLEKGHSFFFIGHRILNREKIYVGYTFDLDLPEFTAKDYLKILNKIDLFKYSKPDYHAAFSYNLIVAKIPIELDSYITPEIAGSGMVIRNNEELLFITSYEHKQIKKFTPLIEYLGLLHPSYLKLFSI